MIFEEFNQYSEDLLLAQYDVSDIIAHELTKGEVREDFLSDILKSRFDPKPTFYKGALSDGTTQSGQVDLMLCKPNSQIYRLGSQAIINLDDCLCAIEVKGNAIGNDIKEFNEKITEIKLMQAVDFPLCGIFCYQVKLKERTILKRFGYNFDAATNTFYDDDSLNIVYSEIDFFVSIETDKSIFLRKNVDGKFLRMSQYPIITNVFSLIHSLISTR